MADPSRKFPREVQSLESQLESERAAVEERDERIKRLESRIASNTEREEETRFKRAAIRRLVITVFLFLAFVSGATLLVLNLGEGENWLQKIINSWLVFTLTLGAAVIFGWAYIGKRGLVALGWPFDRIFKVRD